MNIFEMEQAVSQAEADLKRADMVAEKLARLLVGRLRKVGSPSTLGKLKRELRDFNIHTGSWSTKP